MMIKSNGILEEDQIVEARDMTQYWSACLTDARLCKILALQKERKEVKVLQYKGI